MEDAKVENVEIRDVCISSSSSPAVSEISASLDRSSMRAANRESMTDEDDGRRSSYIYETTNNGSHARRGSNIHATKSETNINSTSSSSKNSNYYVMKNRKKQRLSNFDQEFNFLIDQNSNITWGSATTDFVVSIVSFQVVQPQKAVHYNITVTSTRNGHFKRDGLPSTELSFFYKEFSRIFFPIVIPSIPDLFPAETGQLGVELWLNWLGRHPVVGKSKVFWHMLKFQSSKDWMSEKSEVKSMPRLTEKCQMTAGVSKCSLNGCSETFDKEEDYADKVEKKLGRMKLVVDETIRQKTASNNIVKSIGDEIRNFCVVAKFRGESESGTDVSELFFTAGQNISECEDSLRRDLQRSVNRMKYQISITHSIYQKLHLLLLSKEVRKSVKTFEESQQGNSDSPKNEGKNMKAFMMCCCVMSEINYLRQYERDILFIPLVVMLQDTHSYFSDISHKLEATLKQIRE